MKIRKISLRRSRSPKYSVLGHFALLFCRGRLSNVQRFQTHVQSYCSAHKPFVLCRSRCRGLLKLPRVFSRPTQICKELRRHLVLRICRVFFACTATLCGRCFVQTSTSCRVIMNAEVFVKSIKIKFWTTCRFKLKQLHYSLPISLRGRNLKLII